MSLPYDELKNKVLSRYGELDSIPENVYRAMRQYKELGVDALDDDNVYNTLIAERDYVMPSETPTEIRQRAKTEFARDMLEQKRQEAASLKEANPIASALFPRTVQEESVRRQDPNSSVFSNFGNILYGSLKDAASLPGRLAAEGFGLATDFAHQASYGTEMPSFSEIGRNLGDIDSNIGKKIVGDPLMIPALASGLAPYATARIALGGGIPLADTFIEKNKIGETPSKTDYALALLAGIVPEAIKKVIQPRTIAAELTSPETKAAIRGFLEGEELPIKYKPSKAAKGYMDQYGDVAEAEATGWLSHEDAAKLYPSFPKRPPESKLADKLASVPRTVQLIPGVRQTGNAAAGVASLVKGIGNLRQSDNLSRMILMSAASGEISPTERNAYLRAVETKNEKLIQEFLSRKKK